MFKKKLIGKTTKSYEQCMVNLSQIPLNALRFFMLLLVHFIEQQKESHVY